MLLYKQNPREVLMTVEERVREVAEDIVHLPEDFARDSKLVELGLDSLDITELVMELEEEFADQDLNVEDDVVEKWETFGDLIEYIENQVE
jgi:acyl carrier protein